MKKAAVKRSATRLDRLSKIYALTSILGEAIKDIVPESVTCRKLEDINPTDAVHEIVLGSSKERRVLKRQVSDLKNRIKELEYSLYSAQGSIRAAEHAFRDGNGVRDSLDVRVKKLVERNADNERKLRLVKPSQGGLVDILRDAMRESKCPDIRSRIERWLSAHNTTPRVCG